MKKRVKSVNVSFWMTPNLSKAFDEACAKDHRDKSGALRMIIVEYIERMGVKIEEE